MTISFGEEKNLLYRKVSRLREIDEGDLLLLVFENATDLDEDDVDYRFCRIDVAKIVVLGEKGVRYDGPTDTLRTMGPSAPDTDPIYEEEDFSFSCCGGFTPLEIWILRKSQQKERGE